MAAERPFFLTTWFTSFISLVTIIAFFAFIWIITHSMKTHLEEHGVHDPRQLSTILEVVPDHASHSRA